EYSPPRALRHHDRPVLRQHLLEPLQTEPVLERRQHTEGRDVSAAHAVDHVGNRHPAYFLTDLDPDLSQTGPPQLRRQYFDRRESRPVDDGDAGKEGVQVEVFDVPRRECPDAEPAAAGVWAAGGQQESRLTEGT